MRGRWHWDSILICVSGFGPIESKRHLILQVYGHGIDFMDSFPLNRTSRTTLDWTAWILWRWLWLLRRLAVPEGLVEWLADANACAGVQY
jgi:hypothetical protein